MSETDPIVSLRPRRSGAVAEQYQTRQSDAAQQVTFDRRELHTILDVYGLKVAAGEWRDYAMDFGRDAAEFSVFRRTSEVPLYRIVKQPKLARKQGMYCVVAPGSIVLRRGHDLKQVLRVFHKQPKLVAVL